ncbi:MAG: cupredoxin domain-containing protein [Dehalococcoidia bacterium]
MLMFTRVIIPFVLVVAAGAMIACGGSNTDPTADATKVADQAPSTTFDLVAKGNKFEQKILVAKAGADVKISLSNQDSGTLHNFALYTDKSAKENLYRGEVFEGKKVVDDTFKAPSAGIYFFRCDVHPDAMTGTFVTK